MVGSQIIQETLTRGFPSLKGQQGRGQNECYFSRNLDPYFYRLGDTRDVTAGGFPWVPSVCTRVEVRQTLRDFPVPRLSCPRVSPFDS